MIILADAKPGDEEAIGALCAELNEFYGSTLAGSARERARQVRAVLFGRPPLAQALLAWDGTALAGFAAYSFHWPAVGLTASLYLKELYVAAAYRRAGTGRLLMDRLHQVAAARGCSRLEWTTDTGNTGAQAFYAAVGAQAFTAKIFYRSTGLPADAGNSPATRGAAPEPRLILIRGNSASGKSTVATAIRDRHDRRGLAIVSQDNLRRVVLRERDVPGGANIGLIDLTTRYAIGAGFHVILKGIPPAEHYSGMLARLLADYAGQCHAYYLDVPFAETLLLLGSEASRQAILVNRRRSEHLLRL